MLPVTTGSTTKLQLKKYKNAPVTKPQMPLETLLDQCNLGFEEVDERLCFYNKDPRVSYIDTFKELFCRLCNNGEDIPDEEFSQFKPGFTVVCQMNMIQKTCPSINTRCFMARFFTNYETRALQNISCFSLTFEPKTSTLRGIRNKHVSSSSSSSSSTSYPYTPVYEESLEEDDLQASHGDGIGMATLSAHSVPIVSKTDNDEFDNDDIVTLSVPSSINLLEYGLAVHDFFDRQRQLIQRYRGMVHLASISLLEDSTLDINYLIALIHSVLVNFKYGYPPFSHYAVYNIFNLAPTDAAEEADFIDWEQVSTQAMIHGLESGLYMNYVDSLYYCHRETTPYICSVLEWLTVEYCNQFLCLSESMSGFIGVKRYEMGSCKFTAKQNTCKLNQIKKCTICFDNLDAFKKTHIARIFSVKTPKASGNNKKSVENDQMEPPTKKRKLNTGKSHIPNTNNVKVKEFDFLTLWLRSMHAKRYADVGFYFSEIVSLAGPKHPDQVNRRLYSREEKERYFSLNLDAVYKSGIPNTLYTTFPGMPHLNPKSGYEHFVKHHDDICFYFEYIYRIFCVEGEVMFRFYNWFVLVTILGIKVPVALDLVGSTMMGKSCVARSIMAMTGASLSLLLGWTEFLSKRSFNNELESIFFLVAEEARFVNMDANAWSYVNNLITGERQTINEKHVKAHQAANTFNCMFLIDNLNLISSESNEKHSSSSSSSSTKGHQGAQDGKMRRHVVMVGNDSKLLLERPLESSDIKSRFYHLTADRNPEEMAEFINGLTFLIRYLYGLDLLESSPSKFIELVQATQNKYVREKKSDSNVFLSFLKECLENGSYTYPIAKEWHGPLRQESNSDHHVEQGVTSMGDGFSSHLQRHVPSHVILRQLEKDGTPMIIHSTDLGMEHILEKMPNVLEYHSYVHKKFKGKCLAGNKIPWDQSRLVRLPVLFEHFKAYEAKRRVGTKLSNTDRLGSLDMDLNTFALMMEQFCGRITMGTRTEGIFVDSQLVSDLIMLPTLSSARFLFTKRFGIEIQVKNSIVLPAMFTGKTNVDHDYVTTTSNTNTSIGDNTVEMDQVSNQSIRQVFKSGGVTMHVDLEKPMFEKGAFVIKVGKKNR